MTKRKVDAVPEDVAIKRLAGVDACTVSDALDSQGLDGVLQGLGPLWAGPSVVGRAITVKLVPAAGAAPSRIHLGVEAILAATPGDVLVVDGCGRRDCGSWGGLLSLAASLRHVGGVVLHGACRDIAEASDLKLPVWGLAATPVTARGRMVEAATGEPLIIGAVTICTGDIVVADASGVAVIPASHADEVVGAAERIRDRERAMADRLREGITPNLVLGAGYEELLRFTKT